MLIPAVYYLWLVSISSWNWQATTRATVGLDLSSYQLEFQSKTKKIIEKIEHFSEVKKLKDQENTKTNSIKNKKHRYKKKKFFKKKIFKKTK